MFWYLLGITTTALIRTTSETEAYPHLEGDKASVLLLQVGDVF